MILFDLFVPPEKPLYNEPPPMKKVRNEDLLI